MNRPVGCSGRLTLLIAMVAIFVGLTISNPPNTEPGIGGSEVIPAVKIWSAGLYPDDPIDYAYVARESPNGSVQKIRLRSGRRFEFVVSPRGEVEAAEKLRPLED
jgi:hypothetical protein